MTCEKNTCTNTLEYCTVLIYHNNKNLFVLSILIKTDVLKPPCQYFLVFFHRFCGPNDFD